MPIMLIIIYFARYFFIVNIRSCQCDTIISIIRDRTSLLAEVSHDTSASRERLHQQTSKLKPPRKEP